MRYSFSAVPMSRFGLSTPSSSWIANRKHRLKVGQRIVNVSAGSEIRPRFGQVGDDWRWD